MYASLSFCEQYHIIFSSFLPYFVRYWEQSHQRQTIVFPALEQGAGAEKGHLTILPLRYSEIIQQFLDVWMPANG